MSVKETGNVWRNGLNLYVVKDPDALRRSSMDAIYLSLFTLTTLGYGDMRGPAAPRNGQKCSPNTLRCPPRLLTIFATIVLL